MNWKQAGVNHSRRECQFALEEAYANYRLERGLFLRDGIRPIRCLSVPEFRELADEAYYEFGPLPAWRMEDMVCNSRFDVVQGWLRKRWASKRTGNALMFGGIDLKFLKSKGFHFTGHMLDEELFPHIFEVRRNRITFSQRLPIFVREVRQ